ncbi:MAG TPA: hypothetical protein DCZ48_14815 [Methylococcaceae bacterium]|nr:hypothetical protein [Methylococcaceae bacterium]
MNKTENNEKFNYIGWVPCLNGELVFDLVECGLKSNSHESISLIYYGKRSDGELIEHVLTYSVVNWKDFGGSDVNGLWSVILLSRRNTRERLHKGAVLVSIYDKKKSKDWDDVINLLQTINATSKRDIVSELMGEFEKLEQATESVLETDPNCYKAYFQLEQNGIVTLNYHNKGKECDHFDAKVITRQAYYYIKYAWHKHQHHDSRAETLTTCHEFGSNTDNHEVAERLIGDLKRNLVRFKRGIDHSSHREVLKATGIVSYTKSLVEILKAKSFIKDEIYEKEINHLGYFKESLEAISAAIEKDIAMHNRAVNDARAIILFVFAIMTPALVINRDSISEHFSTTEMPFYLRFVGELYSNQTHFLIFAVFISIILIALISMQTRYGNSWIFWRCFTKPIAYMINDQTPDSSLSKTKIISILAMVFGIMVMIVCFVHLVLFDSALFR